MGAPFLGVVTMQVTVGDVVEAGGVVATIEAMKMEAAITSQTRGRVARVVIPTTQQVEPGDLLVVLESVSE